MSTQVASVPLTRDRLSGAAARDVTAQKQASQYARSLLEASPDPLVTISPQGKITDVNEATMRVTGVARDKLVGTDFSDYFTEPDKARAGYRQVFAQGFVTDYPLTIRRTDGRLTDVLYNASVYRDTAGEVLGVFAAARDVTAQKQAEAELAAANIALNARNGELRDFASVVSHDLRAPVRRIQIFAEMAQEQPGKDDDLLGRIRSSAARMEELVIDLLTYARLGASATGMQPVDLGAVIRDALDEQQAALTEAHVVLEVDGLPRIDGDAALLRQLFANLIENAAKFAKEGVPPVITIAAAQGALEPAGQPYIELAVSDNGIGFDPEYATRIFGIFERLSINYAGTGVGLAICEKVVTLHGGTIKATSTPGAGATFTVRLPVVQTKEQARG